MPRLFQRLQFRRIALTSLMIPVVLCGVQSARGDDAAPATAAAVPTTSTPAVDPALEALIQQLGATEFQDREAASKQLLTFGRGAREALAAHLHDPDPEIRERAKVLHEQVRYAVIPGIDQATMQVLIETLKATPEDPEPWIKLIDGTLATMGPETPGRQAGHGAAVWYLLLELAHSTGLDKASKGPDNWSIQKDRFINRNDLMQGDDDDDDDDDDDFGEDLSADERLKVAASTGLIVTLERVTAVDLAQTLGRLTDAERQASYAFLDRSTPMNTYAGLTQYYLWKALGEHRRAYVIGRSLNSVLNMIELTPSLADDVRQGGLSDAVWKVALAELAARNGDANGQGASHSHQDDYKQIVLLRSYLQLADELGQADIIPKLVELVPMSDWTCTVMTQNLIQSKHAPAVAPLLAARTSPTSMLLRRYGEQGTLDWVISDADWQIVDAAISTEPEATDVAKACSKFQNNREEQAWRRVVELAPPTSLECATAHAALATLAFREGRFSLALKESEIVIEMSRKNDQISGLGRRLMPGMATLKDYALPENEAYRGAIQRSRQALQMEKVELAAAEGRAAIALRPDGIEAKMALLRALKADERFEEISVAGKELAAVASTAETTSMHYELAFLLSEVGELDAAQIEINKVLAEAPGNVGMAFVQGLLLERQGRYRDAFQTIKAARAQGFRSNDLGRTLAVITAESGDLVGAERLLMQHLRTYPSSLYTRIVLWCVRGRLGIDDRAGVAQYIRVVQADTSVWSGKLLQFCAGEIDSAALLAAAGQAKEPHRVVGQRCEANFYLGQAALIAGRRDEAVGYFQRVLDAKIYPYIETSWATAELARLKREAATAPGAPAAANSANSANTANTNNGAVASPDAVPLP